MELDLFILTMMEKELKKIVNYVIKKDILILLLLLAQNVILEDVFGLLMEKEEFQKIVMDAKEKDFMKDKN